MKKILCLNGWGQEPKTLENAFKEVFKDVDFETHDYVTNNDSDGLFPRDYKGCKEYDITIAWSLGTHCAINLIQKKLLKTKLLILIAPIFQFVENEINKIGMPKEMFDGFLSNFNKHPEATMRHLVAMSASGDENADLVFDKMKIQDLNVLSCYHLEQELLNLKSFSCFDVNFKKFPKTICFSGANDAVVPSSQTKLFAERIKDFELHIIENCGHAPHFSHIKEIEKVLKNLLSPVQYEEMLEETWGKPSYSSGLDLFGKSHESVANNTKATADNISSTSLEKLFSEVDNNK